VPHSDDGHGQRRPQPSPAGSERPYSRRPSTARITTLQVLVDDLSARHKRDLHIAAGRAFDEGQEAERARTEALQASLGKADAMIWELQADLRQAQDDLEASRDEVRLRGEKLQDLQLALDDAHAEIHRLRAERESMRPPRMRRSVTQMQVPEVQDALREQSRQRTAEDFARLTGRRPPLPRKDDG